MILKKNFLFLYNINRKLVSEKLIYRFTDVFSKYNSNISNMALNYSPYFDGDKSHITYRLRSPNFNTCICGYILRKTEPTYTELLKFVSKKHNSYPIFLSYEDTKIQLDDKIPENVGYLEIIYIFDENKKLDKYIKFIMTDLHSYQLAMIKLNIFVKNENINKDKPYSDIWRHIEKKEISTIVKIIKETDKFYIVKLSDYYFVCWGQGPVSSSLYALLQKNPRKVYPIGLKYSSFEDFIVKYVKEYDNSEYDNFEAEQWNLCTPEPCCICYENTTEIYCYCDNFHLTTCGKCIGKLTDCLICYKKILGYDKIRYEL